MWRTLSQLLFIAFQPYFSQHFRFQLVSANGGCWSHWICFIDSASFVFLVVFLLGFFHFWLALLHFFCVPISDEIKKNWAFCFSNWFCIRLNFIKPLKTIQRKTHNHYYTFRIYYLLELQYIYMYVCKTVRSLI